MNRRRFLAALGAITTASGGIAATGATLAQSVTPASDFRAIAAADLTVARGDHDPASEPEYQDSSLAFSTLDRDETPIAYVNEKTDSELTIETAVEGDTSVSQTFADLIAVENAGDTTEDVGITWDQFGDDTTGDVSSQGGDVEETNVVETYTFYADTTGDGNKDTKISPTSPDGQAANTVTVDPGTTAQLDLAVSLDATTVEQIETAADFSGTTWDNTDNVDLLDSITVGSA